MIAPNKFNNNYENYYNFTFQGANVNRHIWKAHTTLCLFPYKQFDTVYKPEVTPGVDRSSVTYPSAKVKM